MRRAAALLCTLLFTRSAAAQQDTGHKKLGSLGLRAGAQPAPGFYLSNRFLAYSSDEIRDRHGDPIDVGLNLHAVSQTFGARAVFLLPIMGTHFGVAVSCPVARIVGSTESPLASIDRFGMGDVYVQPAELGWRLPHLDIVVGYDLYLPTGRFEPRGRTGVGRGHVTHQFSAGFAVYLDRKRDYHLSALASYDLNEKKRGVDITRGDTIQVQGGAGARFLQLFEVGMVGYALMQVRPDHGADLPPVFASARDRVIGVGAEVTTLLPPIHGMLSLRWVHDVLARSRTIGDVIAASFSVAFSPL